jgi:hypothetical protein
MEIGKEHFVLICVERTVNNGLLVKMNDLKYMNSDEFYLVRKTNGHFIRLNPSNNLQLCYKEEFRNLIFDLAFSQQISGQEVIEQNLTFTQEKM